jgi:hypothetical protein
MSLLHRLACLLLLSFPLAVPAAGQTSADFKGETVTIQIGHGPDGGHDTCRLALAHHYGRLIPDHPAVRVNEHAGMTQQDIA